MDDTEDSMSVVSSRDGAMSEATMSDIFELNENNPDVKSNVEVQVIEKENCQEKKS